MLLKQIFMVLFGHSYLVLLKLMISLPQQIAFTQDHGEKIIEFV